MKNFKFLPLIALLAVVAFSSCEKDPDWNKLDSKYVVRTEYDKSAKFGTYNSYYVNDTVYVIGGSKNEKIEKWTYNESARAKGMLDKVINQMEDYGYSRVTGNIEQIKSKTDLVIQLTYIQNTQYLVSGYSSWWDYWYDYAGWYWGYYPYYPYSVYPIIYTYAVGAINIDMIDNTAAPIQNPGDHKPRKPIIWNAYASGQLSSSNQFNQEVVEWSINQAFSQSPYLAVPLFRK